MAKSSNQKLKLLYLMKILNDETDENNPLTLAQIAEKLAGYGISAERKSLYADMEDLRLFGVNVEGQRGKSFSYFVAQRPFQLPELKLLVDAVQSSRFITHKKSAELIRKIEGLASRHQGSQLQRQVHTINRIKTMNESIYYNIDSVHEAITAGCKITFQYYEWSIDFTKNDPVVRRARRAGQVYEVSPWALSWDDENYYLIAYEELAGAIRHYRVDRMQGITVLKKKREGADQFEKFDMALYSKSLFGMFGGEREDVKLRFANELIGVVVDRFGKDIFIKKYDDKSFSVTVPVVASNQFLAWVWGFGQEAEILAPAHLREQMYAESEKAATHYKNKK